MNEVNKSSNAAPPVVLGHAACTGGSLIYRVICSTFNLIGLSEIGVARVDSTSRYNPWDPECQLFASGAIDPIDFAEIVFQRIVDCEQRFNRQSSRLLIREHTHSFYFNPVVPELVPDGGSWVADEYEKQFQRSVPCIVTVRNPIDSWLGFRRSFETQEPTDFDTYCRVYNEYLDRIDRQTETDNRFIVIRYENFIEAPQEVMDRIAGHINAPCTPVNLSSVGKLMGSGNSGRISSQLSKRSRRPFTNRLVKQARNSKEYARLCERLEYPLLHEDVTSKERLLAFFYSGLSVFSGLFSISERFARWLREMFRTFRNIS